MCAGWARDELQDVRQPPRLCPPGGSSVLALLSLAGPATGTLLRSWHVECVQLHWQTSGGMLEQVSMTQCGCTLLQTSLLVTYVIASPPEVGCAVCEHRDNSLVLSECGGLRALQLIPLWINVLICTCCTRRTAQCASAQTHVWLSGAAQNTFLAVRAPGSCVAVYDLAMLHWSMLMNPKRRQSSCVTWLAANLCLLLACRVACEDTEEVRVVTLVWNLDCGA
eukprot:4517154-Amphidinium_carterae.2